MPFAALALSAVLAAAAMPVKEPATADGVRHAENLWSEAFVSGDTAALEALLDPGYVSVTATGVARPKAQIVDLARAYAAKNPGQHAQPLAATSVIEIQGRTALVKHNAPGAYSMDLFYYADGRWRAWYSQHAAAPPAA